MRIHVLLQSSNLSLEEATSADLAEIEQIVKERMVNLLLNSAWRWLLTECCNVYQRFFFPNIQNCRLQFQLLHFHKQNGFFLITINTEKNILQFYLNLFCYFYGLQLKHCLISFIVYILIMCVVIFIFHSFCQVFFFFHK